MRFNHLTGLREALIAILDHYVAAKAPSIECETGEEFHSIACRTFRDGGQTRLSWESFFRPLCSKFF
jgi:hypothetical protein